MKFLIMGVGDGVEDSAVGVTYSTKPNNPNVLLGTGQYNNKNKISYILFWGKIKRRT